jgi:GNAT superfamily N-acetyltransferase
MAKEVLPFEEGLKTYRFKKYDLQNFEDQCIDLMPLIVDGFWPNFGGSRPTQKEFIKLFAPVKHVICTDCSRLVYDSQNKLVGMSYACKVPSDVETVVYHSFAIDPAHRKSGIGQKIFAIALEETVKKYKKIVGALAKEGRTAYDKMGEATREYKVFSKRILP